MRSISYTSIAIIIGFVGVILTVVSLTLVAPPSLIIEKIGLISIFFLAVFVCLYLASYFLIKKIIISKIQPIYKTITTPIKTHKNEKKKKINYDDFDEISKANSEVAEWAKQKYLQIEELKRLEKFRKEFIGDISHELKTPIFSIQGYIATLLDGGIEDETINKKYLEKSDKAINRLISIVKDLDSISGLESGGYKLIPETFDIYSLVLDVFESNEVLAKSNKISLGFGEEYIKPVLVRADKKLIGQLLNNLIANSIKYSNENGKTQVSFFDMDDHILVEVKDFGIGIEEKHINRIFERFYRIDKSRSRDFGGTGLGLAIVKHIVEAHGQTINVKSQPGKGSSFTFTLENANKKS